jgi:hypothetical protein
MKTLVASFVAILCAVPLVGSAQTARPADRPAGDARDTKAPAWKHEAGLHETKDIIGTRIKNAEGKDIGEIDQLLIDRNGRVSHVVVGMGGLAGVGEKKVVVPWADLKFAPVTEGKRNAITMDERKLEAAPRYERSARSDAAPAASPRTDPALKDSDRDGKSDRTDRAPLDRSRK